MVPYLPTEVSWASKNLGITSFATRPINLLILIIKMTLLLQVMFTEHIILGLMVYVLAQAVITKHHRLNGLNN